MPDGLDVQTIANDPDFHAMPLDQRAKVMSKADPDFAGLPTQEQYKAVSGMQLSYMKMHPNTQGQQPANPNPLRTYGSDLWNATKGMARSFAEPLADLGSMGESEERARFGGVPQAVPVGVQHYQEQKKEGYNLPYRMAAPVAETLGTNVSGMEESARRGDPGGVLAHAAAGATVASAPLIAEGLGKGVRGAGRATGPLRQAAAEKIVSPITYENLGETKADIRTDINPERGLTREGMVGSKKGLAEEQIPARLTELKTAANQILQNHPNGGTVIDAEPFIDQAMDNAIGETEKVAGSTERLENLRAALKTKYGPIRGTPAQINDLKTDIQAAARGVGAYKNTQPVEASVASAMGQAARLIRSRVDELIPEAAELNGRMSDLIDAQAGIRSKIAGERGQSLFGNFGRSIPSTVLNRTVGSAPVRTAVARAVNVGNVLDVPEPLPPRPGPAGLLPAAPLFTPPPADTSGPVDLGAPTIQPRADNRLLPAAGQTTGPRTVSGPSQFGVSLPEETPRPLVGPERQLPERASPAGRGLAPDATVPLGKQKVWQNPGPIELGPSSEPSDLTREPSGPKTPPSSTAAELGPKQTDPQSIIESAGGKWLGIQKGYGIRPDQAQFQAGDAGTTLSIDIDKLTADAVREKIRGAKGL